MNTKTRNFNNFNSWKRAANRNSPVICTNIGGQKYMAQGTWKRKNGTLTIRADWNGATGTIQKIIS